MERKMYLSSAVNDFAVILDPVMGHAFMTRRLDSRVVLLIISWRSDVLLRKGSLP